MPFRSVNWHQYWNSIGTNDNNCIICIESFIFLCRHSHSIIQFMFSSFNKFEEVFSFLRDFVSILKCCCFSPLPSSSFILHPLLLVLFLSFSPFAIFAIFAMQFCSSSTLESLQRVINVKEISFCPKAMRHCHRTYSANLIDDYTQKRNTVLQFVTFNIGGVIIVCRLKRMNVNHPNKAIVIVFFNLNICCWVFSPLLFFLHLTFFPILSFCHYCWLKTICHCICLA